MRPLEQTSEPGTQGRALFVCGIKMQHWRTIGCSQTCRLLIGQVTSNVGSGDPRDLVPVHKSVTSLGANDDSVEFV